MHNTSTVSIDEEEIIVVIDLVLDLIVESITCHRIREETAIEQSFSKGMIKDDLCFVSS